MPSCSPLLSREGERGGAGGAVRATFAGTLPVSIPATAIPALPELPGCDWQWPQAVLFQPPQVPEEWVQVMEHNEEGRLAFTDEFLDLMAGTSWNGHQKFLCTLVGQSIGG